MENRKSLDQLFIEAKGEGIFYAGRLIIRLDRIPINKIQHIQLDFIATNSNWKQGFILKTKGDFIFDDGGVVNFRPVFWEDTAPKHISLVVKSKNKELLVYNVWDTGNGSTDYWHNGAAMEVVVNGNERTYYCNDGYPDTDFNDLIFKITLLEG